MNLRRDQLEAWEGEAKTNQKTGAFLSQMPLKIVKNSACIRNDGSKTNFASLCLHQVVMNFSKRKIFTNLTQQTIAQELVSLMAARKRWAKNRNGNQSKNKFRGFLIKLADPSRFIIEMGSARLKLSTADSSNSELAATLARSFSRESACEAISKNNRKAKTNLNQSKLF